jgi:transposase-like protein
VVRQAQVDTGARPGTTTEESAEVRRLKREKAELKRANAIEKAEIYTLLLAGLVAAGVLRLVTRFNDRD